MVSVSIVLTAILSIIFGILILIWPKILNYLIGIYLILIGVLQLTGNYIGFSPIS